MNTVSRVNNPRFITFEGIDGAGKSTHIAWFVDILRQQGEVLLTREPGGTPLGENLRVMMLNYPMHSETETMLMFAARLEHIEKVIKPALQQGIRVVSDRFSDASFAYQGGGRGVNINKLEQIEHWVLGDLQPDLTILFDLPVEIALQRLSNNLSLDRFEQEQSNFFERVRQAYLKRSQQFPHRFVLIDAAQPPQKVKENLENTILTYCY